MYEIQSVCRILRVVSWFVRFCPSQFCLLSEVRGLVTPQDLEQFDGMVLRREIQALKARQGPAGTTAVQPDSLSMVSYPDNSSSASFMTNTTLSSARVGGGTITRVQFSCFFTLESVHMRTCPTRLNVFQYGECVRWILITVRLFLLLILHFSSHNTWR